jgi:hypothetical protein
MQSGVNLDQMVEIDADLFFDPEEGRREFEAMVQEFMGISSDEFIRRFEAGEYWGIADEEGHRHIGDLIMLIPLARTTP